MKLTKFFNSSIWYLGSQILNVSILLFINVYLARKIGPSDFGIMSVVLSFVSISRLISEAGLGGAIIRKPKMTEIDLSTMFIVNFLLAFTIYSFIFIFSTEISIFFNKPELDFLLKFTLIIVIINSFQFVQVVRVLKRLEFKKKAFVESGSIILSAISAIIVSELNYGIYALVLFHVMTASISVIIYFISGEFIRKIDFSTQSFRSNFEYGKNTTLASLLNLAFENSYPLIFSKYFSFAESGNYFQAKKFQDVMVGFSEKYFQSVFFSYASNYYDTKNLYKKFVQNFCVGILFGSAILFFVLQFYSNKFVPLILGEGWKSAIFYSEILFSSAFFVINDNLIRTIFKVENKTALVLNLEILKKLLLTIVIVAGIYYKEIEIFMFGYLIVHFINSCISVYFYVKKGDVSISVMPNVYFILYLLFIILVFLF